MTEDYEPLLEQAFLAAERDGIHIPVIALLEGDSTHASSILHELTCVLSHESIAQVDGGNNKAAAWDIDLACRLLRQHCGIGGSAAANLLARGISVDYWLVILKREALIITGWCDDRMRIRSSVLFDQLFFELCDCCQKGSGPFFKLAMLKSGKHTVIKGTNAVETVYVLTLVTITSTRRLPPLNPEDGDRGLPVKDADLAEILLEHFRVRPESVAHALRVLRKADRTAYRRLSKILDSYPVLNELAIEARKSQTDES